MNIDGGVSRSVLNDGARQGIILQQKGFLKRLFFLPIFAKYSPGTRERLRVKRPLYVGGVPRGVGEAALGLWHLRNATSMRGCLLSLYINQKQLGMKLYNKIKSFIVKLTANFYSSACVQVKKYIFRFILYLILSDFLQTGERRGGILPGCHQRYLGRTSSDDTGAGLIRERPGRRERQERRRQGRDKEKGGCGGHRCRKEGTRSCEPQGRKEYRCRCRRGFTGRYCERAPTCRKKKTRKYVEENGCRSVQSSSSCPGLNPCLDHRYTLRLFFEQNVGLDCFH